jgi:tRNA (cytidine32/uridine32-2'-O)-methyltransferase
MAAEARTKFLAQVRIVLVGTSHAGNIGSAARALKTMGLGSLHLAAPRTSIGPESYALASGADDVLQKATTHVDLATALADCHVSFGTTARPRYLGDAPLNATRMASLAVSAAAAGQNVALVFGNEQSGLSNEELMLCTHTVTIAANPEYSSLNLAQAVMVLSYQLRQASLTESSLPAAREVVDHAAFNSFFKHLEDVLTEIEFLDPDNPRQMLRRLHTLFYRATPDATEMHILRGMLGALAKKERSRAAQWQRAAQKPP